jgi:CheY-like chemotaxis protein
VTRWNASVGRASTWFVVDWTMPVMDGAAFLQACRREAGTSALPVVVMSGAPEAATQALRLGAAAVVAKPFRFDELEQLLARVIDAPESEADCQR